MLMPWAQNSEHAQSYVNNLPKLSPRSATSAVSGTSIAAALHRLYSYEDDVPMDESSEIELLYSQDW